MLKRQSKHNKLKKFTKFFNPKTVRGGMTLFALVFALTGGGYYLLKSGASGRYKVTNMVFKSGACTDVNVCLGTLTLKINDTTDPTKLIKYSWKAFSGLGGQTSLDPCYINHGIIPSTSGTNPLTGITYTNHYRATLIQNRIAPAVNGFSFELSQGTTSFGSSLFNCGKPGSYRSLMLIHSEMLPNQLQGQTEPTRWDGLSDYYSNGCIKIAYPDMVEEGGSTLSIEHVLRQYGLLYDGLNFPVIVITP